MSVKRVLSVGQCMADHTSIAWTFRSQFQAEVRPTDTVDEALEQLRNDTFDLVLVNRVFDADGASGMGFIRQMKADEVFRAVPVMLVSNYEDAQREAEQAGAVPGFGKAALGQPAMLGRVKAFLS
jgi:DNA-binding NtrC family response regulator